MSKEEGLRAEHFFMSKLNEKGIPYTYDDDWYDFTVNKQKVEVKSCRMFIHNWKKNKLLFGRYKFTSKENREQQYDENIWVCFIIRHKGQYLFEGFVRAKKLEKKAHVAIKKVLELNTLTFEEWIKEVLR